MENVSATTLGEGSLTDKRAGFYTMASLNSHELGHQWFGDTVTCKDWGQIWLNESFATYMQMIYFEHSRGKWAYQREVDNNMRGYFAESRRYQRPLATTLYPNADAMFDQHTYPKGGVILHTLRRKLGDRAFYAGLHLYLNQHQHTPVESNDLCEAFTDGSGINCHPFFDQWVYKPGHPVIDWSWTWDDIAKNVVVHVKQVQDISNGTPVYDVDTAIGVIGPQVDVSGRIVGLVQEAPIHLNAAEQDFRVKASVKPQAVLFDPEHNFLREIKSQPWTPEELPGILQYAPNANDKMAAFGRMMGASPSDDAVKTVVAFEQTDNDLFPALPSLLPLANLKREDLRGFWQQQLKHANFQRRGEAVRALAMLKKDDATAQQFRSFVNDTAPYSMVTASIAGLADWDFEKNLDVIQKATQMSSLRNVIRTAAFSALGNSHSSKGLEVLISEAGSNSPAETRVAVLQYLGNLETTDQRPREVIRSALADKDLTVVYSAVRAAVGRVDKTLVPDLQKAAQRPDLTPILRTYIGDSIKLLQ